MRHPLSRPGPLLWALCACLLLLPHAATAGPPSLTADAPQLLASHGPLLHAHIPVVEGQTREPEEDVSGGEVTPSVQARTSLLAPPHDASSACVPQRESTCPTSPALQPFSPRPPPASPHSHSVRRRI